MIDPLLDLLEQTWSSLEQAVPDPKAAWRTPVLATVDREGRPAARMVVLRRVDRSERRLRVHTDGRSPKMAEIAATPAVELLFWDPARRRQARVSGLAKTADPEETIAAWRATPPAAWINYGAEPSPGAPVADPAAVSTPSEAAAAAAFRILVISIMRIDLLDLSSNPMRRADYQWGDASVADPSARWIAP